LHFHPLIGGVVIPILALGALFLLPFIDFTPDNVGVYFRSRRGRFLSLMAVGSSILLTTAWVVIDDRFLQWNAWLPDWPSLITEGWIPLAIVLLGLMLIDEFIRKALGASAEERILFLFTFLFIALIVLTAIGIFFRGPGMGLFWPWDITTH